MKKGWLYAIVIAGALLLLWILFMMITKRGPDWMGVVGFTPQAVDDPAFIPGKTIWDLLELLIVPAALALIAVWFSNRGREDDRDAATQRAEVDRQAAEKRAKTDHAIATDRLQEAALYAYYDKMGELLLKENLRIAPEGDEVILLAKTRTLATLRSLDGVRKGLLVRFLNEAGLINKDNPIIYLREADLEGAVLSGTNLSGANLSGARLVKAELSASNLSESRLSGVDLRGAGLCSAYLFEAALFEADLQGADLSGADLSGANLNSANLTHAQLEQANLRWTDLTDAEGVTKEQLAAARSLFMTTLPDGSEYHPDTHPEIASLRQANGLDQGDA